MYLFNIVIDNKKTGCKMLRFAVTQITHLIDFNDRRPRGINNPQSESIPFILLFSAIIIKYDPFHQIVVALID